MTTVPNDAPLIVAAVGDVHDRFTEMVALVEAEARARRITVDHVVQVGDFQANRHEADLATMVAPSKYRKLGDFHKRWAHRQRFPWPLSFIAGNHEPMGWLETMPEGGDLLPGCRYLGRVGRAQVGGITILGLSGIYLPNRYRLPRPGPTEFALRSNKDYIGFTEAEVERAVDLGPVDILLLHDWPSGIVSETDRALFQEGHRTGEPEEIGNDPARLLVELVQPRLVLCGHHHRRYASAIALENGRMAAVHCLANVATGEGAVALFRISASSLELLTPIR